MELSVVVPWMQCFSNRTRPCYHGRCLCDVSLMEEQMNCKPLSRESAPAWGHSMAYTSAMDVVEGSRRSSLTPPPCQHSKDHERRFEANGSPQTDDRSRAAYMHDAAGIAVAREANLWLIGCWVECDCRSFCMQRTSFAGLSTAAAIRTVGRGRQAHFCFVLAGSRCEAGGDGAEHASGLRSVQ